MTTTIDSARAYMTTRIDTYTAATDPAAAMAALAALEAACRKARERIAVHLVLDDGWTYAQLGRATGVTRQAATKLYAPAVRETMRRHIRGGR